MSTADKRILVVDPGKMTGWGFLDVFQHPDDLKEDVSFRGGEMAHDDFIDWASQVISNVGALDLIGDPVGPIDLVIVEGFTITERTIQQAPDDRSMWSVKQVGILETFCRWWPTELRRQMPSDKAFGTDAMLKRVGWWDPMPGAKGERGHRRDAARHALKYVVDKQIIDLRRLLP
jgi:hypothetical protein